MYVRVMAQNMEYGVLTGGIYHVVVLVEVVAVWRVEGGTVGKTAG